MKNLCILRVAAHATFVVSFSLGFAATVSAYPEGLTGESGQNQGHYCFPACHAGGTRPTVSFDGPGTMDPGSTATFSFTVTSHSASQIAAGLDVAASGGALGLVPEQGTRLELNGDTGSNEVTHSSPKANDPNGQAIFGFTWQAPASAGTYTLFGAGASVNLDDMTTGDSAARTTYEVVVGAAPPTCVGDCGNDGEVTVGNLITGVNIALGVTPPSACPAFEANANGDGEVTIDEIQQAVNSALFGCPI